MADSSPNVELDANDQYKLAKLLLHKYDTFHPFLQLQMEGYTIACCNIALGGQVKMSAAKKTITYEIKTEKKFTRKGKEFFPVGKNNKTQKKINDKQYQEEKKIAKLNLVAWTQHLLWAEETKVKVFVDGSEIK